MDTTLGVQTNHSKIFIDILYRYIISDNTLELVEFKKDEKRKDKKNNN